MAGARRIDDFGGVTLDGDAIAAAARALDEAERTGRQIRLLSETYAGLTMDDAYAIQTEWVRMKAAAGDPVIGWKIGLTSKAMQAALSIDIPDSGVLLRSMAFDNGAHIAPGRFIQPRIEAEIAFVMRTGLEPEEISAEAILAATDYVAPALEILDTRITRKDPETGRLRNVCDTISDNAANGGIVLGAPVRDLAALDLRFVGAIVSKDGEVEETGLGAGVLGDPLVSMAWLVERLATCGDRVEAGQVILSGSFIRPIEAPPGSDIAADFGPFGRVECRFG
ncbi:2-oxo-hept-4-ene-1,7-dioate hydratase [Croceicoccus naphthovorans]|uniref:2-oxo-hept-4-ene-1,7-dioate hydratase n=1 Tax=Croceicoccus naphthovorans TaxID=1348774 RepID=UPI0009E6512C|nr:2-oxo-hepta-3-ene-1,7-dioic acid hydratase [Croceicoccus naphthovorans]MBB3992322.1 2-oxo-hept-3-ene-1,7-dioate hydratase [Croceicoccus naphthovorans]